MEKKYQRIENTFTKRGTNRKLKSLNKSGCSFEKLNKNNHKEKQKKIKYIYKDFRSTKKRFKNCICDDKIFLLFFYLMIVSLSFTTLSDKKKIVLQYSYITLKVNKTGLIKIFHDDLGTFPDEVHLNGFNQSIIKSNYQIDSLEDIIQLIWNNNINSTECMFYKCSDIKEINLTYLDTSQVTTMRHMFHSCSAITSLDLSNFNTINVKNMGGMFAYCSSLRNINLSSFDTYQVTNMGEIFYSCESLISLDLSNFNTSNAKNMERMFGRCYSLSSLNLSNFDTSYVNEMGGMFEGCKFTSLDLSNFNTSKVLWADYMFSHCSKLASLILPDFKHILVINSMFYGCSSLTSLNLTNFDTTKVTDMNHLFYGCSSLISLDLSSFRTLKVKSISSMFEGCTSLNSLDISNFNISKITNVDNVFDGCSSLDYINLENTSFNGKFSSIFSNINLEKIIICGSDDEIILNNSNLSKFINCNDNNHIISNKEFICYKKELNEELNNNEFICEKCGKYFYKIIDQLNINNSYIDNSYIDCYRYPKGYYLDNKIYKPCHINCKTCNKEGNESYHNCIECKKDYKYYMNQSNLINCLNYCPNYYYIDIIMNKTFCTLDLTCPYNYNKLIVNRSQCIDDCIKDPIFKYEYNNTCYDKNDYLYFNKEKTNIISENNYLLKTEFTISDNTVKINYIDKIENNKSKFENILEYILNNYNKTDILNGNDLEFEVEELDMFFSLTTPNNQKNNINKNKTILNLSECENILKNNNNISNNESLFILKIDKREKGMKIPKIEYEIYYPLYNNKLVKLNLTFCKNSKIEVSIPVKINDNINKFNPRSEYYNNICYQATTEKGTDITLSDRKNEFINNNLTLCEEDCHLIEYNYTSEKAKCSCLIKISLPLIEDIKFDKNKLYKSFIDIKNFTNIMILKCYKNALNFKILLKNYGFLIYMIILLLFIITFFLFYCKYYSKLEQLIKKLSEAKNEILKIENIEDNDINIYNDNLNKKNHNNKSNKTKVSKFKKNKNHNFPPIKGKANKSKKNKQNLKLQKNNIHKYNNNNKNIHGIQSNSKRKINFNNSKKISNQSLNNKYKTYRDILEYNDYELNSLEYDKALISDKRTFLQYYLSLLRTGHLFIFSFYSNNKDYNVQIIKIYLFFFIFAIHLMVNALFFNDETMHKIYEDEGTFNFIYQIPQIIYSSLISGFIKAIIKFLSLSEKNILQIKKEKSKSINSKVKEILRIIKIKFSLFFLLTFLLLLFFMYYITCFCGVYINSQIHLIKDSLISFGLSMVYPFGIYLIPGIFRITSLKAKKKDKKYIYNISQLIQMI